MRALCGLLVLAAAGCSVAPKPLTLHPDAPEAFEQQGAGSSSDSSIAFPATPLRTDWWAEFNDPLLVELIETSLRNNHSIAIAAANLSAARARLGDRNYDRWPNPELAADAERSRASNSLRNINSSTPSISNRFSVNLGVSWELDLFGRVRSLIDSAEAQLQATEWDWRDTRLVIAADVATQYLSLRAAQQRLVVAEKNVAIQQQTLELIEALSKSGAGNALDVQLATASVASIRADIPQLRADVTAAIYRLSVLSGNQLHAMRERLETVDKVPAGPSTIAVEDPIALLRRRPDVRAAEARLAIANANTAVAAADLYPRLSLNGLLGFAAREPSNLLDSQSQTASMGLGLRWPLFSLVRQRLIVQAEQAEAKAAYLNAQQKMLLAIEELETALLRFRSANKRLAFAEQAKVASSKAASLARKRFRAGASAFLSVLEAEERRLRSEDVFVQAQLAVVQSAVLVYRALAGEWWESSAE